MLFGIPTLLAPTIKIDSLLTRGMELMEILSSVRIFLKKSLLEIDCLDSDKKCQAIIKKGLLYVPTYKPHSVRDDCKAAHHCKQFEFQFPEC